MILFLGASEPRELRDLRGCPPGAPGRPRGDGGHGVRQHQGSLGQTPDQLSETHVHQGLQDREGTRHSVPSILFIQSLHKVNFALSSLFLEHKFSGFRFSADLKIR